MSPAANVQSPISKGLAFESNVVKISRNLSMIILGPYDIMALHVTSIYTIIKAINEFLNAFPLKICKAENAKIVLIKMVPFAAIYVFSFTFSF